MSLHDRYGLTRVINARGTFTPLGVSRSSAHVAASVAQSLGDFFVIDELQSVLSRTVAESTGAEAGAVVHCVAAGITLSVAAAMTGSDPASIAALPFTPGMMSRIVLPAAHAVDYGHPVVTDIRLAGATPVLAGSAGACSIAELEAALAHESTAGLLLVSSRLVRGEPLDLRAAVQAAHRRGVPAIVDGAAQDLRIDELLATGADIVLVSAQKYLAAPTAGLVVGRREMVQAVRAQERGIGRAMKASKEAIVGVLAALEERRQLNPRAWVEEQQEKVRSFIDQARERLRSLQVIGVPDPSGMPFSRVCLTVEPAGSGWNASVLAAGLQAGDPAVWLMDHAALEGQLFLELVPLQAHEIRLIVDRIAALVPQQAGQPPDLI